MKTTAGTSAIGYRYKVIAETTAAVGTPETVGNSSPVGKPEKAGLSATLEIQATAGTL